MGQKANPIDLRRGVTTGWPSRWFSGHRDYAKKLLQDIRIRKFLHAKLKDASISEIEIERDGSHTSIRISSSKPGVIIGRSGTAIDDLKKVLDRKFEGHFDLSIKEIKNPDLDAAILADSVAFQLERRIAFRRAAKSAIRKAMESGAKGVKISVGGRLGGADIARSEFFSEGKIPLQTFRADISYAMKRAETTYGTIGIKVWIFRGEVFRDRVQKKMKSDEALS